jgi:catalase
LTYFARPEFHNLLADSGEVVASAGVVSTIAALDSVPEQFFDDFASVLARRRAWDRETDSVPAGSL